MASLTGIFNVTDDSMSYGDIPLPGGDPTTNTSNLQQWVYLLLDPNGPTLGQGGTLQFPVHKEPYKFDRPITIDQSELKPIPRVSSSPEPAKAGRIKCFCSRPRIPISSLLQITLGATRALVASRFRTCLLSIPFRAQTTRLLPRFESATRHRGSRACKSGNNATRHG
jgi:hypothetical protein